MRNIGCVNLIGLVCSAVLASACCSDDDDDDHGADILLQTQLRLMGKWLYIDPATNCESTFEFVDSISFEQTSLDEVTRGIYELFPIDGEDDLFYLEYYYSYDNGGADCLGDSSPSEGWYGIDVSLPDDDTLVFSSEISEDTLEFSRVPLEGASGDDTIEISSYFHH